jgi:hypothetical protein
VMLMEKKGFDEVAERLLEINKTIAKLDPAIRSSAFELVKGYVSTGTQSTLSPDAKPKNEPHGGVVDLGALIAAHPEARPSENLELLTAYWYGNYGVTPFTVENLREAATDGGLTIPDRPDKTLKVAKEGGKKLYQSAGRGLFKPTVPGEMHLKQTYSLRKGTGTPPTAVKK